MMSANLHAQEAQPNVRVMQLSTFVSINFSDHKVNDDISIFVADLDAAEVLAHDILAGVQKTREAQMREAKQELVEAQ